MCMDLELVKYWFYILYFYSFVIIEWNQTLFSRAFDGGLASLFSIQYINQRTKTKSICWASIYSSWTTTELHVQLHNTLSISFYKKFTCSFSTWNNCCVFSKLTLEKKPVEIRDQYVFYVLRNVPLLNEWPLLSQILLCFWWIKFYVASHLTNLNEPEISIQKERR